MDFVVGDRSFETGHIVFSVRDDLGEFSVRSALDLGGAQIGYLQALSHRSAATIWSVAGCALRFIDRCTGCTVLSSCRVRGQHDDNNKKTRGPRQNIRKRQFPGVKFHNPPKVFDRRSRSLSRAARRNHVILVVRLSQINGHGWRKTGVPPVIQRSVNNGRGRRPRQTVRRRAYATVQTQRPPLLTIARIAPVRFAGQEKANGIL